MLLLDEPLGALDLKLREEMQGELKPLQRQLGITFVFVTHDQGEALSMADRVAVFNDGRIVQVGAPGGDLRAPAHALRRRFRRLLQRPDAAIFRSAAPAAAQLDEPPAGEDRASLARHGARRPTAERRRRHRRRGPLSGRH